MNLIEVIKNFGKVNFKNLREKAELKSFKGIEIKLSDEIIQDDNFSRQDVELNIEKIMDLYQRFIEFNKLEAKYVNDNLNGIFNYYTCLLNGAGSDVIRIEIYKTRFEIFAEINIDGCISEYPLKISCKPFTIENLTSE
jgi:hypothetical protein